MCLISPWLTLTMMQLVGSVRLGTRSFTSLRRCLTWIRGIVRSQSMLRLIKHRCYLTPVHAWDYRRYVLSSMPTKRSETSELAYTTRKIESNFSNFSAWHQRSKVLARLWDSGDLDQGRSKEAGTYPSAAHLQLCTDCISFPEFELVRNAMYTDPNDQSVWMYHRWLIGKGKSPLIQARMMVD